jgi:pantoate--beta-alanine ligase
MSLMVLRNAEEMKEAVLASRAEGKRIGFVPTMGALHEGHAQLLRRAVEENETSVLSIFVNPTQFGPSEDFSRYPRTLEADLELAKKCGVTHVFHPDFTVVYPKGYATYLEVEGVSAPLCGAFRPGHFRGVATVVHRLFQLVRPDVAYFGQKDLQQCLVIERMVRDLSLPVKIAICPTLREADGLAMSSRNRYLNAEERLKAVVIYRALELVRERYQNGEESVPSLLAAASEAFSTVPELEIQYAEIRSLPGLESLERVEGPAAFVIAGFLGKTRLIDNWIFARS